MDICAIDVPPHLCFIDGECLQSQHCIKWADRRTESPSGGGHIAAGTHRRFAYSPYTCGNGDYVERVIMMNDQIGA